MSNLITKGSYHLYNDDYDIISSQHKLVLCQQYHLLAKIYSATGAQQGLNKLDQASRLRRRVCEITQIWIHCLYHLMWTCLYETETYAIIYVLIHHIIFWLYLYFLNIRYFFKYSCTNIFHIHSLCTFHWAVYCHFCESGLFWLIPHYAYGAWANNSMRSRNTLWLSAGGSMLSAVPMGVFLPVPVRMFWQCDRGV